MYGPDVFAALTAHDQKNKAGTAFELEHNVRWFRRATGGVAVVPTINSRETTPAEDSQSDDDDDNVQERDSAVNRLVITFDQLSALDNLQNGLQLGTNPIVSHVLLGHRGTKGISGKQCNITVDDALHIWLHDYESTHGTAVGQNGQNQTEVRKRETWILGYAPGTPDELEERTIHCSSLGMRVEFPNHAAAPPRYVENLRAFFKKCQEAAERTKVDPPGVETLALESEPATQAPSEAPTPRDRLVFYEVKKIGEGAFGRVHKVIKARDGKVFAAKVFNPPLSRNKRRRDEHDSEWLIKIRREFTLMRDNPHPNVIQVFELRETPAPVIIMAYCPLGNIVDAGIVSDNRYVTAWGQVLDGLSHLHSRKMAHRDLKPENFLVEMDPLFKIVIADFGLAKVATDTALLQTFCGSLKYAAPEVFPNMSPGYGPPVDIWSLGVIVFEWIYGIPNPPSLPTPRNKNERVSDRKLYHWLDEWTTLLLDKLEDQEDDRVIQILAHMIETRAPLRWAAIRCLAQGLKSGVFKRRVADGLVACASDPDDDLDLPTEEGEDGTRRPTAESSPGSTLTLSSVSMSSAGGDPEATVILGNMWGGGALANSH